MNFETLLYEVRDEVGLVTLNRPAQKNAFDEVMRRELPELIRIVKHDAGVKAVVLTGAGGAFCAGGDIRGMMASQNRTAYDSRQRIHALHAWLPELVNLEKPLIAAVDGPAFGGGFSFALAADFVLASERARFCQVFGRIGLVPDTFSMYLLPRVVGLARAKELVFSTRVIDANEAKALGIVFEIHPADVLLERALAFAGRFRAASPVAIGLAKSILNQSLHLDQRAMSELESYAQGMCMDTEYHRRAMADFVAGKGVAFKWD